MFRALRAFFGEGAESPRQRAFRLLEANLTPEQRSQLKLEGCFEVIGGTTGQCYRIHNGTAMNVDELDERGRCIRKWCFFPQGNLAAGDVMLAQKFALELFEPDMLRVARNFWSRNMR